MRYTLLRYASAETNWDPAFVLSKWDDTLVRKVDQAVFIFPTIRDAVSWVRDYAGEGSSVEWEGTIF